jgi:hypothetical protein
MEIILIPVAIFYGNKCKKTIDVDTSLGDSYLVAVLDELFLQDSPRSRV